MRTPVEIEKAGAKVIISGAYSLLDTSFGLQVKFDGVHHLEITVPGEYFNKVRRAILLFPPCNFHLTGRQNPSSSLRPNKVK